jgi:hypothetical protein
MKDVHINNQPQSGDEAKFLAAIDNRLESWQRWWRIYMLSHYSLGIAGVICSTIAATELTPNLSKTLSVVSATCLAVIGFVRPEAKYRNMIRAWGELKSARDVYLFKNLDRGELLETLRKCQNIAIEDDIQAIKNSPDKPES